MEQRETQDNDFLKFRIDLPSFQLELNTRNVEHSLTELRKILEAVHLDDDIIYEEFVTQEIRESFSKTFVKNKEVMDLIRSLLKQEDDYRISTVEIPSTTTIDLDDRTRSVRVTRNEAKRCVSKMISSFPSEIVKHGIVHVMGNLDNESKILIIDHIHQHMPTAQLRAFQSPQARTDILVEAIFFGDFPEEE